MRACVGSITHAYARILPVGLGISAGTRERWVRRKRAKISPFPHTHGIQSDLEHQEPDGMTVRCVSGQTIACQVLCRKFDSDLK